jgi:hypothetical protein
MSCWQELGIAPTSDIEAIKKAFAAQSKLHHPEEDPEGFSRLRHAYRSALQQAKSRPDGPQESPSPDMTAKHEPEPEPVLKPPVPGTETLSFEVLYRKKAAAPETKTESTQEGVYDFGAVERAEVPEESCNVGTFTGIPTGLPKQIERQRRLRAAKAGVKTRRVNRPLIFFLIMASLIIWRAIAAAVKTEATPSYVPIIQTAVGTSEDQRQSIRAQAEAILKNHDSDRVRTENEFVQKQILPVVKAGMMDTVGFFIALEFGSMVGMSYSECLTISFEYQTYHDEEALDQVLVQYSGLVPPDEWVSY